MPPTIRWSPLARWRSWRRRRFLGRHGIAADQWRAALRAAPVLWPLDAAEGRRLHELASHFLYAKSIGGAQGMDVTDDIRIYIAAQACLPILNLDMDYFSGWYEVIVYPGSFIVERPVLDAAGVIHGTHSTLGGEAWGRGPVVLSWDDIRPGARAHGPGSNVILHEFAHKLDMLNGAANGLPPLHAAMSRPAWTAAFTAAYDDHRRLVHHHHPTAIDPYGAESPAEFFAVTTEVFFQEPQRLAQAYPPVYTQLAQFYRQDPLRRGPPAPPVSAMRDGRD